MKELLFPIGVNLVLGLVLLVLLIGRRRPDPLRLENEPHALREFQRHHPEATGSAVMSVDRRAALIETGAGTGLLLAHGRRWNACLLAAPELAAVRAVGPTTLELRFANFGFPRARLSFADPQVAHRCRDRLESLLRPAAARGSELHA